MFITSDTFTIGRNVKIRGVQYTKGQTIPAATLMGIRGADTLLSRKIIIPTPDPHGRKTSDATPTPISLPAKIRRKTAGLPKSVEAELHSEDVEADESSDTEPEAEQAPVTPPKKTAATKPATGGKS